ncbi:MAG: hypothetical protein R2832_16470 [Rhodothermales bacterium]
MTDSSEIHKLETETDVSEDSVDAAEDRGSGLSPMPDFENETLRAQLESYETAVDIAIERWADSVRTDIREPLVDTIKAIRSSANDLLRSFNSADLSGPDACRNQILKLRRTARSRIFRRLLEDVAAAEPFQVASDAFQNLLNDLQSAALAMPEDAELIDHASGFLPAGDDTLWMGLKKWNYRRRIRSAGDALSRRVDVRGLGLFNSLNRIPSFLLPLQQDYQQLLGRYLAEIERAAVDLSSAILTVDRPLGPLVRNRAASEAQQDINKVKPPRPDEHETADEDQTREALDSAIDSVRSSLYRFVARLDRLLEEQPVLPPPAPQLTNGARRSMREDLRQSGTPFLAAGQRDIYGDSLAGATDRRASANWQQWHAELLDRLRLSDTMLSLRERMLSAEQSILSEVARASIHPVVETFGRIERLLDESAEKAAQAATAAEEAEDLSELRSVLDRLRTGNVRFLARTLHDLPGIVSADAVLEDPGEHHWPGVLSFVESAPESLQIHRLPDSGTVNPDEGARAIRLREALSESVLPVSRKLKAGAEPLRRALQQLWVEVEKTKTAVEYNLDTAVAELDRIMSGEQASDEHAEDNQDVDEVQEGIRKTTELVVKGYQRAVTSLNDLLPTLGQPWTSFSETLLDEVHQQWAVALRRGRTGDGDDANWEGIVASFNRSRQSLATALGESAAGIGNRLKSWGIMLRRRAKKLIRIGQSAVGAIEAKDEDLQTTLDEVDRLPEMRRELPLVYRHLFSFEPLVEPTLFEGRAEDLVWLRDRYKRWLHGGRSGSFVVSTPVGSGRTTFLNIAMESALDAAETSIVRPLARGDEHAVVGLIAEALGLGIDEEDRTIQSLESAILSTFKPDGGKACVIDDFEMLFLRKAGGADLMERLLLMMSRTDACVFWVCAISDSAWRYLTSIAGAATAYLVHRPLAQISRNTLEEIVMARHKRSAMPIHFELSQAQTDAMRQLLKRSRTDEERQAHARSSYFDRLARVAGQNIQLALFYWIRSAVFPEGTDEVHIQPIEALKFDTLSRYTMQQAFSLEAFLFHKTLSLTEHNDVLRLSERDGTMLIEALLNARLLMRVRAADEERDAVMNGQIQQQDRFRIRPILLHPVRSALSARHLVY